MITQPFALQIYSRYLNGETIQQIAASLQIPVERIEQRIRAAAEYLRRQEKLAA